MCDTALCHALLRLHNPQQWCVNLQVDRMFTTPNPPPPPKSKARKANPAYTLEQTHTSTHSSKHILQPCISGGVNPPCATCSDEPRVACDKEAERRLYNNADLKVKHHGSNVQAAATEKTIPRLMLVRVPYQAFLMSLIAASVFLAVLSTAFEIFLPVSCAANNEEKQVVCQCQELCYR